MCTIREIRSDSESHITETHVRACSQASAAPQGYRERSRALSVGAVDTEVSTMWPHSTLYIVVVRCLACHVHLCTAQVTHFTPQHPPPAVTNKICSIMDLVTRPPPPSLPRPMITHASSTTPVTRLPLEYSISLLFCPPCRWHRRKRAHQ